MTLTLQDTSSTPETTCPVRILLLAIQTLTEPNYAQVVARNPASKLFTCWNCTTNGDGFMIDKDENIPWFVSTLMGLVADIHV